MRILTALQAIIAAAAIAFLAACSGGISVAPKPPSPQSIAYSGMGRAPAILGPMGMLDIKSRTAHHSKGFYACPATGPIKYVSDIGTNVINAYVGKFAGQAPCGQITSGLGGPAGLYVQPTTHDLYVANVNGNDIKVFHRGQLTPYNTYTDPTSQRPIDVGVATDGTVLVSNGRAQNAQVGSISTWIGGPNGGKFVGNFPMTNSAVGWFLTVKRNGLIYFNDTDATTVRGVLWTVSCPAGACGAQTQIAGVAFIVPGGMGFNDTGDLLAVDQQAVTGETFELPNPNPKTFQMHEPGNPLGMAINPLDHHWFVADGSQNDAAEYSYPKGKLIGTVPGNPGGYPFGMAVDPSHAP